MSPGAATRPSGQFESLSAGMGASGACAPLATSMEKTCEPVPMATTSAPPLPAVRVATEGKYCCTPSHMARPVAMVALSPVDGESRQRSQPPVAPLLKRPTMLPPGTAAPAAAAAASARVNRSIFPTGPICARG